MALPHALPSPRFIRDRAVPERRALSFAPPVEAANEASPRLRSIEGGPGARAAALTLVLLAHGAGLAGLAYLAQQPAPALEVPISVALIELPQPLPVAPPTPPAPPKPQVEPPPPPKPRVQRPVPRPVVPVTEAPSAIRSEPAPPAPVQAQPQETPREAPPAPPAPPAAPRAAPEPAAVVAARFDAAYLNNPAPAYPPLSRRMREEGKVMLRVEVTAEGLPAKVELAESSGFARLDAAARDAVQRWRFVPAKQGGQAVAAAVIVPVVFKLEGN